jgi:alginate O-acetyltransferase complex protein AlgI
MLFSSFSFVLFFLPITLIGYFSLNRFRLTTAANAWLLLASLFFYGWWNVRFLPLILGSVLFNYTIGHFIVVSDARGEYSALRKAMFILGIAGNILLLGYFKYTDFFLKNVNVLLGTNITLLHIILPLGISFFTITQIAFLVDAYEGLVEERKLLNYALFVTFFPHLLAGPILHHKEMMPQFNTIRNKVLNYRNLTLGLYLFSLGLFKKVVIADSIAMLANNGFANAGKVTLLEAWVTSLAYAMQLYFDFSGYSDMAIGVGWMFNIDLPLNFNSPYKATNIIDFWKRWHITLTNFVTTYIYTPILRSFSRVTFTASLVAIFLSMFISGFWHGSGWTYILWGTMHGVALVANHVWRKLKFKMHPALGWFLTFNFICLSFVFFRAKSVSEALLILKAMFGGNGVILPEGLAGKFAALNSHWVHFDRMMGNINGHENVLVIFAALFVALRAKNSSMFADRRNFRPSNWNHAFIVFLIVVNLVYMDSLQTKEFLYFGF